MSSLDEAALALLAGLLKTATEKAKATAPVLDFDTSSIDELSLATRYVFHQQHDPDLKLLLEGKSPDWAKDDSGSGRDHNYALTLYRLKYSPAEALWLLSKYQHGKTSRERDQKYLETTVNKIYVPKEKLIPVRRRSVMSITSPPLPSGAKTVNLIVGRSKAGLEKAQSISSLAPLAFIKARPSQGLASR